MLPMKETSWMAVLGLNVTTGSLRWALVDGTRALPVLVDRDKEDYESRNGAAARMVWFYERIERLVTIHCPSAAAYRMHMGRSMTQEQIATFHYPWGVTLLICARAGIQATEFTGASLTAKRFGLSKGDKPMEAVDRVLGTHPPHWDDAVRYAACAAWGALPEAAHQEARLPAAVRSKLRAAKLGT
jgi:Holliday junction resolvasome RuvABC endonuclease subunit